jgi:hypothetical protein
MKISIQILALVAIFALTIAPGQANADSLACGDVITKSVTLDSDLICPDDVTGLIVDGSNITLDLGAYTIEGPSLFPAFISSGVWISPGSHNVTIKNGIIDGFDWGMSSYDVQNLTLDNLVFRGQLTSRGFSAYMSKNVAIKNSSFFGPERTVADPFIVGIEMDNVAGIDVQNVDVHGYHQGMMISCWGGNCMEGPNSGKVSNSSFFGSLSGISIGGAKNIKIAGNHISNCVDLDVFSCAGLAVAYHGMVSDLKVENNTIHGMRIGIVLHGVLNGGYLVTDSKIVGNHITDNFTGILVEGGATGNVIRSNILFDSLWLDLQHDVDSTGNVWINNSCETKLGDDIPDCM